MNYQLHDSRINGIELYSNRITFSFSEGFWKTDESGKEVEQMQNCKLVFVIDTNELPLEDFISVRVSKNNGAYKTVSLSKFISTLRESAFTVDMEYDCSFTNRKMLQIYSDCLCIRAEIFIEEIKKVEYLCGA